MSLNPLELKSMLEAIIYAADEPATVEQLAAAVGEEKHVVRAALDELVPGFASDERGIEIRAVAGGYRFYTKPQHHEVVRRFIKSLRPPLRLTMPALETLAVIAYKQPVTQPEMQEIRGVSCAGVIQTLLERRLIAIAGRKQVIGRPILYRTSKEFLMRFGLGDLEELPSLKEFEALAREALGSDEGLASEAPSAAEGASPAAPSAATADATDSDVSARGVDAVPAADPDVSPSGAEAAEPGAANPGPESSGERPSFAQESAAEAVEPAAEARDRASSA